MQWTASQFYICNNKNYHQINQKCGGFWCRGQPQLYIHNNKNDHQIKNAVDSIALDSFAKNNHQINQNAVDSDAKNRCNYKFAIRTIVK